MKQAWLCGLLLAGASVSQAGIIFLNNVNNGTPASIASLTGLATTGDLMAGMTVSATFSNGQTQNCVWAATGAGSGGCTAGTAGDGSFSLSASGDTYNNPFLLSNLSTTALLLALTINGTPGNAVFDIVATPGLTPGSDLGQAASGFTNQVAPNGLATYSNLVNVGVSPAEGDLYTQLVLDFGLGLAAGTGGTFVADTDSIGVPGGLPGSTPSDVPEPVTYLLCGVSLVAMGLARRVNVGPEDGGGTA